MFNSSILAMANFKSEALIVATFVLSLLVYLRPLNFRAEQLQCLSLPAEVNTNPPVKMGSLSPAQCRLPFVVMFDGGRLGNQVCQYLSLQLLRKTFGIKVAIRSKMMKILKSHFEHIATPLNGTKCFSQPLRTITFHDLYQELFLANEHSVQSYPLSESSFINSYPCPLELLLPRREELRSEVAFKGEILKKARHQMSRALSEAGVVLSPALTLVTVHVRRTDYIEYMKEHYDLKPLGENYFHKAFDYFRERYSNLVFLLVSDDPKWCKEHLLAKDVLYAGSKNDPVSDMALLTLGNHTIVSFGTFGFVGAFLGHGTIVHPANNPTYDCEHSRFTHSVSFD